MNKFIIPGVVVVSAIAWGYSKIRADAFNTGNPLLADSGPVELMDADFSTEALPDGWVHREFFGTTPTDYHLIEENGKRALACTTDDSGSILARETRIQLADLPTLSWNWKIIKPIESSLDEKTEEGDDHPARLFLRFENASTETRSTEIIWSNKQYLPGDYKIIGSFHHLVVNGLDANIGQWHAETVDLRQLYADIGGTGEPALTVLGFFCDSDNTGTESEALFSDVTLSASIP